MGGEHFSRLGLRQGVRRKTIVIVSAITLIETFVLIFFRPVFWPPVLHNAADVNVVGWIAAMVVVIVYIAYAAYGLPTLRRLLFSLAPMALLGLALAIPSSIVEEVFFRQTIMDAEIARPLWVQVGYSGLLFGIVHAIWGVRGGWRGFIGAVSSTTALGVALAIVYLLSGRIVLPCVVAHFLINLVLEPWLVYAYLERASAKIA